MSVDPFIEAEKRGGHSVKRACELLGVSRAAFYARRSGVPGPRAMRSWPSASPRCTHAHEAATARRASMRSCSGTGSGADGGWPG